MPQSFVSALCIASGIGIMGIGVLAARSRLREVRRFHLKHSLIHTAMPEGWGLWFFQGFSGVTTGTRWFVALLRLLLWLAGGLGLISLGLRLA